MRSVCGVAFALVCSFGATGLGDDGAYTIVGQVELVVADPLDFASHSLTASAVEDVILAIVGPEVAGEVLAFNVSVAVGIAEVLPGQPEFELLQAEQERRFMSLTRLTNSATVAYSAVASSALARAAAGALRSLRHDKLGAQIAEALTVVNASNLVGGMRVLSHAVLLLAYDVLGSMGGSTNLTAVPASGVVQLFEAAPARWNAWHPKPAHRNPTCALLRGPPEPSVKGLLVRAIPDYEVQPLGQACGRGVPPAPPSNGAVLLTLRGACPFADKVRTAEDAGFCGLIIANEFAGPPHPSYGLRELPDMTAEPVYKDADIGIPAWLVDERTGRSLLELLAAGGGHVEIRDVYRRPPLGDRQADEFGVRDHQVE